MNHPGTLGYAKQRNWRGTCVEARGRDLGARVGGHDGLRKCKHTTLPRRSGGDQFRDCSEDLVRRQWDSDDAGGRRKDFLGTHAK
jgi:hypothetical protein